MQPLIDEIEKADLAKLHNEVNQLRNHEFFVCSFALALVGSTASVLPPAPITGLSILIVLAGLYVWHLTIMDTRSRITTFLRVSRRSYWEKRYRQFADASDQGRRERWNRGGQRMAAVIIFVVLGLAIPLITFREGLEACLPPNQNCVPLWHWIFIYGLFELAYLGFVTNFGISKNYNKKLDQYMARWRTIMFQETSSIDSLAEDQLIRELSEFSADGGYVNLFDFVQVYHGNSAPELLHALRRLFLLACNGKVDIKSGAPNTHQAMPVIKINQAG